MKNDCIYTRGTDRCHLPDEPRPCRGAEDCPAYRSNKPEKPKKVDRYATLVGFIQSVTRLKLEAAEQYKAMDDEAIAAIADAEIETCAIMERLIKKLEGAEEC